MWQEETGTLTPYHTMHQVRIHQCEDRPMNKQRMRALACFKQLLAHIEEMKEYPVWVEEVLSYLE